MMFAVNLRSSIPIYEQLKKSIMESALLGLLEPDDQLPSVRSLSKELGVNPNTVQKAYQALESEGVIYSLAGRGSFIAPGLRLLPAVRQNAEKNLTTAVREALLAGMNEDEIMEIVRACEKEKEEKSMGGEKE